jgi:hypothetical protein
MRHEKYLLEDILNSSGGTERGDSEMGQKGVVERRQGPGMQNWNII